MIKNNNALYFLNKLSKSFIFFIFLFFCINFEKSLSFIPIFKTATPSLISIIIFICIKKLNIRPSYVNLFFVGFLNEIILGGNLVNTPIFLFLLKYFIEGAFFENINKGNKPDWISFTIIFLSCFFIMFVINIIMNLSIPDLSPIFFYVGITLIIFPLVNLSIEFIFFITRLIKS